MDCRHYVGLGCRQAGLARLPGLTQDIGGPDGLIQTKYILVFPNQPDLRCHFSNSRQPSSVME